MFYYVLKRLFLPFSYMLNLYKHGNPDGKSPQSDPPPDPIWKDQLKMPRLCEYGITLKDIDLIARAT